MAFKIEDEDEKQSFNESLRMKNSSQCENDSSMQLRNTDARQKESAKNDSITTLALEATAAASGGTMTLDLGTSSGLPLQAYKDCIEQGITERTEDASYMNPESVMMASKDQWSNSQVRNGSNLTTHGKQ